jgi:hypothetical protein
MEPLRTIAAILLIPALLAGCSSSPEPEDVDPTAAPAPVEGISGVPIHVEWRNLNPRRPDSPLGVINRSSPELRELYRNPAAYQHVKPVDDDVMAALLGALEELGFFEHASKGVALDTFRPGEGLHGVVHVKRGEETFALVFSPGMYGSEVPEVYRDCKVAIFEVHRRTMWLAPAASEDPDRVFRSPPHAPRR